MCVTYPDDAELLVKSPQGSELCKGWVDCDDCWNVWDWLLGLDACCEPPISNKKSKSPPPVEDFAAGGAVGAAAGWCTGDDWVWWVRGGPGILMPPGGGGNNPGVPPRLGFGRGLETFSPDFLVWNNKRHQLRMYRIHGHCHLIHGESVVFVTYWTSHGSGESNM